MPFTPINLQDFGDGRAHGLSRVERRVRVLEDHLDMAVQRRPVSRLDARNAYRTGCRRLEPDHATGQSRLARAGFANQANAFSLPDFEADAAEGLSRPAATVGEYLTQTDDPENCVWASRLGRLGHARVLGERGGHGGQFVADFVKSDARRFAAWADGDQPRTTGGANIGRPLTARRKGTLARDRVGEWHRAFDDRQG